MAKTTSPKTRVTPTWGIAPLNAHKSDTPWLVVADNLSPLEAARSTKKKRKISKKPQEKASQTHISTGPADLLNMRIIYIMLNLILEHKITHR
jgi:hypothetical protein